MGFINDLGPGNIGVDTVSFIYFIEEHPQFLPIILPLFREADDGKRNMVTSALTLMEVLVVPYRVKTPDALQLVAAISTRCSTFFTNDRRLPAIPGLRIIELTSYAR